MLNGGRRMEKTIKRLKKWKIVLISTLLIVLVSGGIIAGYISSKLSNLTIEGLDKNNLGINKDLYDEVSDVLTRSEFNAIKCIALFGTDSRDSSFEGRSDTIIIAAIKPKTKSIKLISIPRDTYVSIEGHGKDKINHAYAFGKEQLSVKTINQNFGLNITEYVTIDFSGLIHVINKLGGVQLNITNEEKDYINSHASDSYKISKNTSKTLSGYGIITLDGEQALTHSRNRTVGNDFDRAGRQREVLEAIMTKMSKMGSTKILDLSDEFLKEVRTNIKITNYVGVLASVLLSSSSYFSNVISTQTPSTDYAAGKMIDGIYYFVSDPETMRKDMIDNIYRK